jgi:hypothetical protein
MTTLHIELDDDRRWFPPADTVSGRVAWHLDEPADAVELRLFWHTGGKGTEDIEIIDMVQIEAADDAGERGFSFRLPDGPYSFSGTLITLAWALELVALPSGDTERVDLVVAPTPVEVRLTGLGREPEGFSIQLGRRR